eukprot:976045_1
MFMFQIIINRDCAWKAIFPKCMSNDHYIAKSLHSMSSFVFIFLLQIVISESVEPKRTIYCPKDQDCSIICTEAHCLNSHITCPVHHSCNITCNHRSCHETTIDATESTSFNLYLHPNLYSNLTAYLPSSPTNHPRTHIHQTPHFKNDRVDSSDYTLLTLYAINGFNDLISTTPRLPRGRMYCQPQYTSFCTFAAASFSCMNRHHLCSKTTRRRLQSTRSIDAHVNGGIYSDNAHAAIAPAPSYAWTIGYNDLDHGQSGQITPSGSYNVIGPFSGTGTTIVDYIITITQQFACSVPSDVSVRYRVFWCGDTEADDYAKLYLNDVEQSSATVWGMPDSNFDGAVPLADTDALIAATDNSCEVIEPTDTWRYVDIDYNTNLFAGTYQNPVFTVRFDLGLSYDAEWGGIADVNIKCTAIPTLAPTSSTIATPSNHPSIAPVKRARINAVNGQNIDCGFNEDICEIECNLNDPSIPNLYCRDAKLCIIRCAAQWCLWNTKIHAENATNVQMISTAQSCVVDAEMYLPDVGNASIIGDTLGTSDSVLKRFTIYSGKTTDHISIECNGVPGSALSKHCNGIDLDARNAQFVHINIRNAAAAEAVVQCPINSSLSPSCVINATSAVSTSLLEIFADKGMPQDVVFYSNGNGDYDGTTITCSHSVSTIQDNTFVGTPCYIEPETTTINPTQFPSVHPTQFPSVHRTQLPSIEPTEFTSINPTQSPIYIDTPQTETTMLSTTTRSYVSTAYNMISTVQTTYGADKEETSQLNYSFVGLFAALGVLGALLCAGAILCVYRNHSKKALGATTLRLFNSSSNPSTVVAVQSPTSMVSMAATAERQELVKTWLESIVRLPQYLELFVENGYDSMKIVARITDKAELLDMGITMKGHQTLIMCEIENLRDANAHVVPKDTEQIEVEIKKELHEADAGLYEEDSAESSTFSADMNPTVAKDENVTPNEEIVDITREPRSRVIHVTADLSSSDSSVVMLDAVQRSEHVNDVRVVVNKGEADAEYVR